MPWLDAEEAQAEELYNAVTARFVHLVNGLLQQISAEQTGEFAHLPKSLDGEQGFRARSRFSFHEMITIAQPASPLLYSLDAILGMLRIRGLLLRDAKQFLERLLDTNASRVQGDVEQRVVESRLVLESEVRKLLRELTSSAERALSQAREVMMAGAEAVAQQMDTLGRLREELRSMNVGG